MNPARFFLLVPLQSPAMLCGLVMVTLTGLGQIWFAPEAGREAVMTLLLLQAFSASSGFLIPARRGHYDAVLTGGCARRTVVAAHALCSCAPGLLAWVVLGAGERLMGGQAVWAEGSAVALALVSAGGWAATALLPRLSGGLIWLVVYLVGTSRSTPWHQTLVAATSGDARLGGAITYLLCPPALAGRPLGAHDLAALVPVSALVIGGAVAVWRRLTRASLPLETAQ